MGSTVKKYLAIAGVVLVLLGIIRHLYSENAELNRDLGVASSEIETLNVRLASKDEQIELMRSAREIDRKVVEKAKQAESELREELSKSRRESDRRLESMKARFQDRLSEVSGFEAKGEVINNYVSDVIVELEAEMEQMYCGEVACDQQ